MGIELQHLQIDSTNHTVAARDLAEILGVDPPIENVGIFQAVSLSNGVVLDFCAVTHPIVPQHYAFLVSENEFDEIFARIRGRGIVYFANPDGSGIGETYLNSADGRGVYWLSIDGHGLEVFTAVPEM